MYEGESHRQGGCSINSCVRAGTTPVTIGRSLTVKTARRKRALAERKPPTKHLALRHERFLIQ
ncbi:hypothetical protein X777_12000 [Ooceraea biroi]|uniref:Uncharacterized protein n=1 Tax=Ooceraea biroi TaxID=2015173 RepID=A0A026WZM9_OOCBI|nr:hypothetical protein X777_12000 [Ooceraea biroi]